MGKVSMLGAMQDRIKTDLRIPPELLEQTDEVCTALGVPKNAYFSMAAALLTLQLAPLLPAKRRKALVMKLQDLFQKIMVEVVKTL